MSEQPTEPEITEAEVLAHLTRVTHRVAVAIAETLPEEARADAIKAASEVLLDDEGARELLGAAYTEGRTDALKHAVQSGKGPPEPDWSDIERGGERRAIAKEDHICHGCSAQDVCAIAVAMRQVDALVVLQRCDKHR